MMPTILIVEANMPKDVANGFAGATGFVHTIRHLAPDIALRHANPYDRPLSEADLEGVQGAIFTGSGVAWSTDAPEAAPQRDAMEQVFKQGLPVWGSCNGLNLAAGLLGGRIGTNPNGIEVGLARDMQLTPDGADHPMMAGRAVGFGVPCIHRDHVSHLPDGATLLAYNAHTPIQAMAYQGNGVDFWGTQYHPEASPSDIAAYVRARGIFDHLHAMTSDLDAAETDEAAAARLGGSVKELSLTGRSVELANWIRHITRNPA